MEQDEENSPAPDQGQDQHIDQNIDQHMEAASQLVGLHSSMSMQSSLSSFSQVPPIDERPQLLPDVMRDTFVHTQVPNAYHGNQLLNNYSLNGVQPIPIENPPNLGFWGESYVSSGPSWLVGDDFDLEALNSSVTPMIKPDMPLFRIQSRLQTPNNCGPDLSVSPRTADVDTREKLMNDVHNSWFTQVENTSHEVGPSSVAFTSPATPETSPDRCDVDERYRAGLSEMLRPRLCEDPLPSTDYLVCSLPTPVVRVPDNLRPSYLMIIEPLRTDVLFEIQPDVPCYPCSNFPSSAGKLTSSTFDLFSWESAYRFQGGHSSRVEDIREAQQGYTCFGELYKIRMIEKTTY